MEKTKSRGPMKASEAEDAKSAAIPEEVFAVFNELITKNLSGGMATVRQDDAVAEVARRLNVARQTIFENGWMDVESSFRKAGWKVEYDKPGYSEDYPATFTFRRRSKR